MLAKLDNPKIQQILTLKEDNDDSWKADLEKLLNGDVTLDRKTAGENSIKALQRILIFLGYSTSFRGAYRIDGDFGRGTNRGLAQFKLDHGFRVNYDRSTLCYNCKASNAHRLITAIPDVRLTVPTLNKLIDVLEEAMANGKVMCGSFEDAIFHLNNTHRRKSFSCRDIFDRYGQMAKDAVQQIKTEYNIDIHPEWLLAIVRQETGGVIRPRFEQHLMTQYNKKFSDIDLTELRLRATSFGLGQILGVNYKAVGESSAQNMYYSPPKEQMVQIARFLVNRSKKTKSVIIKNKPVDDDFRTIAYYYNGPRYRDHHYHESIARWFKEFQNIMV